MNQYYSGTLKTKGSKSHKYGRRKKTKMVNRIIEIRFIHIPTLTISGILK
jgi:hypothetical protein